MKYTFITKEFRRTIKANSEEEAYGILMNRYTLDDLFYITKPRETYKFKTPYEIRMIKDAANVLVKNRDINKDDAIIAANCYFDEWIDHFNDYVIDLFDEEEFERNNNN